MNVFITVADTFLLRTHNLCLIGQKVIIIIFRGCIFYVHLPIIQLTDNSKENL